ncbi:MAG TPA: acetylxylan esterase [Pirellulales bacterium]|nr:acetylxylan esterase [Pirellulales bacterium]
MYCRLLNHSLSPCWMMLLCMLGGTAAWDTHFAVAAPTVDVPPSAISRVLPAGKLPADSRLGPLKDLNGYFPFTPPNTREDWDDRAEHVRRQIEVAAGLWPMPEKTPLNAVVWGRVDRDDYTVEKVYFESYPGYFVTGNLYRPKGHTGKLPGVLCPYGHFADGRFNVVPLDSPDPKVVTVKKLIQAGAEKFEGSGQHPVQAYPVQLARMGCIAFQYDMAGYDDSLQIPFDVAHFHSQQRPQMDTLQNWGFYSPQADLHLQSILGLQTYNSVRALDFLCQLPDVDPDRLAVTGASSGGTQTLMLCAIDPRPAVAVPAVMVSTAMQGGCTCENADLLRLDTGNVEFAALFAPKPLCAIAANDWTKELATKGGPELQQLYDLLGAHDNLQIKPFLEFPHNFNYVSRSAMYQWMNKQLKLGLPEPVVEADFVPLSRAEMTVWDDQHHQPVGGEDFERNLLRTMTEDARNQLTKLIPHDDKSLSAFRHVVGDAWDVLIGRGVSKPADVEFQQQGDTLRHEKFLQKKGLLLYKPRQEEVPAILLQPRGETNRTVIWLDPAGKAALFAADGSPKPLIRKLLDSGAQVIGLDLLYQGEFLSDGKPLEHTRQVATKDRNSAAYTFGYNRALFAQRVHDVLTAISYFRGDDQPWGAIDLVGLNGAGRWAIAAKAMAGKAVDRTVADTAGFRFGNVTAIDHPDFLPGGAKYFDLPGLLALCAPRELWLRGEALPDAAATASAAPASASASDAASPAPPPATATDMDVVAAAFKSAGALDKITLYDGPADKAEEAAIDWLLKK